MCQSVIRAVSSVNPKKLMVLRKKNREHGPIETDEVILRIFASAESRLSARLFCLRAE